MTAHASRSHVVGQIYRQFKLVNLIPLPELQCRLHEWVHEPSGARVMHIENKDPENVFCLSFQTLPVTSNGVAHILEHTVLCGSRKFPVKDPFFSMSRRSLNTFMNALTGADFTCYPAASEIHKDFYHLLEVYLDAVFHPLLSELSFAQEGHRLEFSHSSDPDSPLEHKGIVYNEMKGALSSPSARLSEALNAALFPDVTYGCNSGGDPKEIPQLTYSELKQFYETFYHPARCLFFFYGNMPLEGHLDFITEHALNGVSPVAPLPPIPLQPRFEAPIYRDCLYPIAPDEESEGKTLIAFGWLTCSIAEQQEVLALNILEVILLDTDASPLKMALLQSGFCKQVNAFIDVEINQIPWGIILKGCRPEDADALERVVRDTLENVCTTGLSLTAIENAIHQLEFHRSEITGDHAPFGLSLFMRSGLLKQHGVDPAVGLRVHSLCDSLRRKAVEDPGYFGRLIRTHFLDNSHFVRLVMRPDSSLGERELEAEKEGLARIKASLSETQKRVLVEEAGKLTEFQKREEEGDIDVLPKLSLDDIPLSAKDYLLTKEKVGPLTVFHHPVFTNEIVYADLIFDLPDFTEADLPYLRLFMVALTQVGCASRSYRENLEYIQGNTGGIGAGLSLNVSASDPNSLSPAFHLRGKALYRKAPKLFSLLRETLSSARIDSLQRLKEILLKHFTALESSLNHSALKYAVHLAASHFNVPSKLANDLYGLNYYRNIREIVRQFDIKGPYLLAKLQEIQEKVAHWHRPHLVLACDSIAYDAFKSHDFYELADGEGSPFEPWQGRLSLTVPVPQGVIIASPVAFIGKVVPTVPYTHPDAVALSIAACLFDHLTLHTAIREKGGAYGGGAVSHPLSGIFHFYSYRDPHIAVTFKAFEEAVAEVLDGNFDEDDLEKAKFDMIQGLSAPVAPGSQADMAYGWEREGRPLAVRQAFRQKLLAMTREEVIEAVERGLIEPMKEGAPVVFAGKELMERENLKLVAEGRLPLTIESV